LDQWRCNRAFGYRRKPGKPQAAFHLGFVAKGSNFSHTFDQEGSFSYFCKRHPRMQATVKVAP
jgi:plastocyanin